MTFFLLYHVQKVTRNYGGKCYEIKYYRTRKISIVIAVNTQSLMLLVEQKASTMLCPRTLFDATSAVFQERLDIFISSSVDLLHVLQCNRSSHLPLWLSNLFFVLKFQILV